MKKPVLQRIAERSTPEPMSGCWLWTGTLFSGTGYGCITVDGKSKYAHRVSFESAHGAIPAGLFVCHRCDVRSCVNPAHLFVGTQSDNMIDCASKGRISRKHGAENPASKLTADQVEHIRVLIGLDIITQRLIARAFGVAESVVSRIKTGQRWAHA